MSLMAVQSTTVSTSNENNEVHTQQIRDQLSQGRLFATIKGIFHTPNDYFLRSANAWKFSPPDAMDDWHYLIPRLQTKTSVLKTRSSALFDMINKALEEDEAIFIHCTEGRHRSAAFVIFFLVVIHGLTVHEAFKLVRDRRVCAIHYELSEFTPFLEDYYREHNDNNRQSI